MQIQPWWPQQLKTNFPSWKLCEARGENNIMDKIQENEREKVKNTLNMKEERTIKVEKKTSQTT